MGLQGLVIRIFKTSDKGFHTPKGYYKGENKEKKQREKKEKKKGKCFAFKVTTLKKTTLLPATANPCLGIQT